MKYTMLALTAAALLAGPSSVALAQGNMPGTNQPGAQEPTTGKNPGGYNNGAAGMHENQGMHQNPGMHEERTGMSEDQVKQLQTALEQKGQHVTVDGKWGNQTANALRNFQKENGLQPTGRLDPETSEKLGLPSSG